MTIRKSNLYRWTILATKVLSITALPGWVTGEENSLRPAAESGAIFRTAALSPSLSLVAANTRQTHQANKGDQESVHYLEVVLNEMPTGLMARFVSVAGKMHADADTLRNLGLRWPGSEQASGLIPLAGISGLHANYLARQQRIKILVPVDMLATPPNHFGYVQPKRAIIDPATRAPGLATNYDIFARHNDNSTSFSGWSEWRLFGTHGVLSNSMVSRYINHDLSPAQSSNTRLDTTWQLDFPDSMVTLSVGDSITGALPWTRPTRIGGLRLSRNFALQPYRVHTPLFSFMGSSVLPSTADLFINGVKQSSHDLAPGQFQIDSSPTLSGAGQAHVAVTDINGRVRLFNFSLYGAPELLQQGVSDWSIELGSMRENYAVDSFSYHDEALISATGRYGLSHHFTLESHFEATDGLSMAGLGGNWLLGGRAGVLSLATAQSQHGSRNGKLVRAGYQWTSPGVSFGLNTSLRDKEFRDTASANSGQPPRRTHQVFLGIGGNQYGNLSLNFIQQEYEKNETWPWHDAPRTRLINVGWSRQILHGAMLSLSVNRNLDSKDGNSLFAHLSIPLDRFSSAAMSARHSKNHHSMTMEAKRTVQTDTGGWGWRAQSTVGDSAATRAEVTHLGQYGQWTAGASRHKHSDTTAYGSASGSVILMDGHMRAMRHTDDAFALVSTNGIADVPVKLENRLVGHTDDHGVLLLNRLNAWQHNKLSIDTLELPADMYVERTEVQAVPATRSGTLVRFNIRRMLSVKLVLKDSGGNVLPPGSTVQVHNAPSHAAAASTTHQTVVGFDGMVYLRNPTSGATLQVQTATTECTVRLPDFPDQTGLLDLGVHQCL